MIAKSNQRILLIQIVISNTQTCRYPSSRYRSSAVHVYYYYRVSKTSERILYAYYEAKSKKFVLGQRSENNDIRLISRVSFLLLFFFIQRILVEIKTCQPENFPY